jgi:CRISPR-associated protein Csb2
MPALLISVRFHDGRYHGAGNWPPAPARLFQALVAAAAKPALEQSSRYALKWLEQLSAPVIAAPAKHEGKHVSLFVPNNDIDSVGGIADKIITKGQGENKKKGPAISFIKTGKAVRPRLFDASVPLLYVWCLDFEKVGDESHAKQICQIADGLYQLGRGVDMAWAVAEVLDDAAAEVCLSGHQGVVYRPSVGENSSGGVELACPEQGSLESLMERYKAGTTRFRRNGAKTEFANAPKPRFRQVAYNSPATRLLFDIRRTTDAGLPFAPWPLKQAAKLVQILRDGAVAKLSQQNLSKHFDAGTINKALIGKDATQADKSLRVRIVPLPSIGHAQVNRSIRRVLVEVPPACLIRADDMAWAFAGLEIAPQVADPEAGEITSSPVELVATDDYDMLEHYGLAGARSSRLWRSVTPLALPDAAKRRRIAPARQKEQAKQGNERQAENRNAIHEVAQALRHAGLRHRIANIRVQREPFEARGERAEAFAEGRFSKHQLWHVEIEFAEPVSGLTVLGNGRYCGLGLMAPVWQTDGVHAFAITEGLMNEANTLELARALRRAVMARVQDVQNKERGKREKLPLFFTGHEDDGAAARSGSHAHLAFVPDLKRKRLLVIAPHIVEHREPTKDEWDEYKNSGHLVTLAQALQGLTELRAGKSGLLRLAPQAMAMDADPLFAASTQWTAPQAAYQPTRHAKKNGKDSLQTDLLREAVRRNLPAPQQIIINGNLSLQFAVAVPGPVLLGKDFHLGGGVFAAAKEKGT